MIQVVLFAPLVFEVGEGRSVSRKLKSDQTSRDEGERGVHAVEIVGHVEQSCGEEDMLVLMNLDDVKDI